MPYNIAANLLPVQPVTSFMRGRALRLAEQSEQERLRQEQERIDLMRKQMEAQAQDRQERLDETRERNRITFMAKAYDIYGDIAVTSHSAYQRAKDLGMSDEEAQLAGQKVLDENRQRFESMYAGVPGTEALGGQLDKFFTYDQKNIEAAAFRYADDDTRTRLFGKTPELVTFRDPETAKYIGEAMEGTPQYAALLNAGARPSKSGLGTPSQEGLTPRSSNPTNQYLSSALDKLANGVPRGQLNPAEEFALASEEAGKDALSRTLSLLLGDGNSAPGVDVPINGGQPAPAGSQLDSQQLMKEIEAQLNSGQISQEDADNLWIELGLPGNSPRQRKLISDFLNQ